MSQVAKRDKRWVLWVEPQVSILESILDKSRRSLLNTSGSGIVQLQNSGTTTIVPI